MIVIKFSEKIKSSIAKKKLDDYNRINEENERKKRAEEESKRLKAEEEKKKLEEAQRLKAEEEEKKKAQRLKAEEEEKKKAQRLKAEEEARKKAEEEKKKAQRKKAKEEAQRKKAEEEARKKAEEEAQRKRGGRGGLTGDDATRQKEREERQDSGVRDLAKRRRRRRMALNPKGNRTNYLKKRLEYMRKLYGNAKYNVSKFFSIDPSADGSNNSGSDSDSDSDNTSKAKGKQKKRKTIVKKKAAAELVASSNTSVSILNNVDEQSFRLKPIDLSDKTILDDSGEFDPQIFYDKVYKLDQQLRLSFRPSLYYKYVLEDNISSAEFDDIIEKMDKHVKYKLYHILMSYLDDEKLLTMYFFEENINPEDLTEEEVFKILSDDNYQKYYKKYYVKNIVYN